MSRFVLKKTRDHSPQASAVRYDKKVAKAKKKSEGGKPPTKSDRVLLEGRRFVTFCVKADRWTAFVGCLPSGVSPNEWFNEVFNELLQKAVERRLSPREAQE